MSGADAVTTFYGRWAILYDLIARRTPGIGSLRSRTAEALAAAPGDTVVEMGCGTGANAQYVGARVGDHGRALGLDITREAVARATAHAERSGLENVHFLLGDATRPPVRGADAILGTFVVGMFDDPGAVVDGWCDLVEPGGRVVLLDATRSARPGAAPLNALFGGFVRVTSPPGTKLRYDEPPARTLDRRVQAAREALAARGEIVVDETHVLGFLRLTAARIDA